MTNPDAIVLACMPVAEARTSPVTGSARGYWCVVCAAEVWVSPSGQRWVADNPSTLTWCTPCALSAADDDYPIHAAPNAPRWAREIANNGGTIGDIRRALGYPEGQP